MTSVIVSTQIWFALPRGSRACTQRFPQENGCSKLPQHQGCLASAYQSCSFHSTGRYAFCRFGCQEISPFSCAHFESSSMVLLRFRCLCRMHSVLNLSCAQHIMLICFCIPGENFHPKCLYMRTSCMEDIRVCVKERERERERERAMWKSHSTKDAL